MSNNTWIESYKHYPQVERITGLKIDSFLGNGAYGVVCSTNDPRLVVKITSDENEVILASKVMDIRRADTKNGVGPSAYLPGLVFIFGVFQVPTFVPQTMSAFSMFAEPSVNLYAIVREAVSPLNHCDNFAVLKKVNSILREVNSAAGKFHNNRGSTRIAEDIEPYLFSVKKLEKRSPNLAHTFQALVSHGIVMKDTHTGNVGLSTVSWGRGYRQPGELVVFDLGFTPTGSDYELEIK